MSDIIRLDLGCGKKPAEGFVGVDAHDFGQEFVCDLRGPWKWEDESVSEVRACHFVEHLTARERIHFANELYRVLVPGGTAEIIVPHFASERAYGDMTHQWPPVSPFWFLYLSRSWREENAPHLCDEYDCDFQIEWGVSLDEAIQLRNQEFQQFAARYYLNAAPDIHSTWRKA